MQADDEFRSFSELMRGTVLETLFTSNRPSNVTCPYPGCQIAAQHAARHHRPLRVVACAGRPLQLCVEPISLPSMSKLYPPRCNDHQEFAALKQKLAASRRAHCGNCKPVTRFDAFQSSCARYGARNAVRLKQAKQCYMSVPWVPNCSAARSKTS